MNKESLPKKSKLLESWVWDATCSIRSAKYAPKYKDYSIPLAFTKRLCDVLDDELNRIADNIIGWKEEGKLNRIVDHDSFNLAA
jgi:type I restriction enzyme M protein